jgi:hypothetical protein
MFDLYFHKAPSNSHGGTALLGRMAWARSRPILVAVLGMFCSLSAQGQSIQPNKWSKLSPGMTVRYYPANWVDCTPTVTSGNPVGRSTSSMVNGPPGKILYWGGGHGSHSGNDAEIFDTATQTWTQQFAPECLEACCRVCSLDTSIDCVTDTDCAGNGTCGTASPLCQTTGRCSYATSYCSCNGMGGGSISQITPHNRPYCEHSMQAYAYNPNPSRQHYLYSAYSGVWTYTPPDTWTLLSTAQPSLPYSFWEAGKLLAYDPTVTCGPDTGAILMFANKGSSNGGIYCFDYLQNQWVTFDMAVTGPTWGAHVISGTFDSTRNEHIISVEETGIWRYKASTKTWTNTNAPAGALETMSAFVSDSVAYDPVHDITLVMKPRLSLPADLWQYNNATGVWSDIDDSQLGTPPPYVSGNAQFNTLRYDGGIFYYLNASAGGAGRGGTPDINTQSGVTTWTFQWNNPPLVGTPTPGTTGPTPTPAATLSTTPLAGSPTPSTTGPTPTPAATLSITPPTPSVPLTWAQRAAQTGVLAAVGFHNATEVAAYANVSTLTGQGPVYDATMNAARFPIINTLPAAQFNSLDNYGWSGSLTYSLPWAQQFDENSEFEVQYLFRDDGWVTELTNKKIDIWGAGDRNPSVPPVSGGPNKSGSCMPDDVVTELYRSFSPAHIAALSGYQGCSSGPAWGNSYAGQIGVDFSDFSPTRNDYWYQPAIASCLRSRLNNGNAGICTEIGANVWQAVTMHFKLGPRGLCNGPCYGVGPWANIPRWQANHAYGKGARVTDSNGNIQWAAYTSGTSGSTEPAWLTAGGSGTTADGATLQWYFYGGPKDWFTNSYFWLAFGWEGHPSTALIYRGPFNYYAPISFTLDYGSPPPKVGKLWLFPYRQSSYDQIGASAMTSSTVTVTGTDITETFPAGSSVTDPYTGYTTLTADAHPGDTTIHVADTSSFRSPIGAVRLWRQMKTGNRWYKEMLIATGSSLADPFGVQPIAWPTPPNSADAYPGPTAPAAGLVPAAPQRPTPPVLY